MKENDRSEGINRREFLQKSALFAASAFFMSFGAAKLFAAPDESTSDVEIESITLNNGVKMPILAGQTHLNIFLHKPLIISN